jgi:hypothetical protein
VISVIVGGEFIMMIKRKITIDRNEDNTNRKPKNEVQRKTQSRTEDSEALMKRKVEKR